MNPEVQAIYNGFAAIGAQKVRENIAGHVYGEDRLRHAESWLAWKDKEGTEAQSASELAFAAEANALARTANTIASEANSLAVRALATARDSNTIAIIAIILSAIAIPVSIVAIFIK